MDTIFSDPQYPRSMKAVAASVMVLGLVGTVGGIALWLTGAAEGIKALFGFGFIFVELALTAVWLRFVIRIKKASTNVQGPT